MTTLIGLLACLYTVDCPRNQECLVDSSGHGYCVSKQSPEIAEVTTGGRGSSCTFQYDCDEGLTCVKARINDFGVCTKMEAQ